MMARKTVTRAGFRKLLAAAGMPSAVSAAFARMGDAEELLEEFGMSKRPGCFMLLAPPAGMAELDPRVYRAHARELLERLRNAGPARRTADKDLDVPTKAELLVALSNFSFKAPPSAVSARLMHKLFVDVMGTSVDGDPPPEPFPGACEELLGQLASRGVGAREVPEELR